MSKQNPIPREKIEGVRIKLLKIIKEHHGATIDYDIEKNIETDPYDAGWNAGMSYGKKEMIEDLENMMRDFKMIGGQGA